MKKQRKWTGGSSYRQQKRYWIFSLVSVRLLLSRRKVQWAIQQWSAFRKSVCRVCRFCHFHHLPRVIRLILVCNITTYQRDWRTKSVRCIGLQYCGTSFLRFHKVGTDYFCHCFAGCLVLCAPLAAGLCLPDQPELVDILCCRFSFHADCTVDHQPSVGQGCLE